MLPEPAQNRDYPELARQIKAWARDLGASNLAALSTYLQTAQPIAALTSTQTGGKSQGQHQVQLDDAQAELCRIGGWDAAVFAPAKA